MKVYRMLAALAALATCCAALAQNSTMTPYSRYGYGMLSDNATSAQRAMGGVGYAMNSGRQINVMNPASYAAIDSLTFLFDMGGQFNALWATEKDAGTDKRLSGGLDYITLSVPITKWMGASAGLLPYSSTGYAFGQLVDNGSVTRQGSGNINQVYLGVGVSPFRNAYVGANFAYMFGSTINDLYAFTSTSNTSLFERFIQVQDWTATVGLQYAVNIGESRVTLGATYSPAKDLHGTTYGVYYDASASEVKPDTVGYSKLNGKYSIPATYGGGVNYSWRGKLMVEADFTYQPWRDAKFAPIENFESTTFDNRWKAALGVQYVPALRGRYWQRAQYRAGVYYNHDYLLIRGNNVLEYGVSLGVGLPVPGFKTIVSLGVEYKHRQANPDPLVKEQYINVTLGVNFNEMWFRKSKIY